MQFSEQWLREWVNPALSTHALCDCLTMAGLEVDAVMPVASPLSGVVVGEIVEAVPHPNADRLRVCVVNVGTQELLSIVCGAANARPGIRVPAALIGARLAGDLEIKRAKLRGVESFGMLCSAKELGIIDAVDGLWELPADAPVGRSIVEYLHLQDVSITLGLTPNRGDCLSVFGVAREVSALTQTALAGTLFQSVKPSISDTFPVVLEAPEACPRYVGRVIRRINPKAHTPIWLSERLRRSGIRRIHPVVDVTNYVLLELGQPMHAFDLSRLRQGISVRLARDGENITLLDGKTITLHDQSVLIADAEGPVALAGVMGGSRTAVDEQSVDLFLEAAFFAPLALAGQARRYGLHTDSSHRFERGVDPALPVRAMERATQLLKQIVGGDPGPLILVESTDHLPQRNALTLRADRVTRMLGQSYAPAAVERALSGLGMSVECTLGNWSVTPPEFRFDITLEADLIEEVARVNGYDNITPIAPVASIVVADHQEETITVDIARTRLIERGYQEAITYSFVAEAMQNRLCPDVVSVALTNPIAADMAVMRTSLWTGLLSVLAYNQHRQQSRVRLFEIGRVFIGGQEPVRVAAVCTGTVLPVGWTSGTRALDFFDIKGDVESILSLSMLNSQYRLIPADNHGVLQAGQAAKIETVSGGHVGWLGALHPGLIEHFELKGTVYVFELEWKALSRVDVPKYTELSKYPSIDRDLAVVVARDIPADRIIECARHAAGALLQELAIFDVYQGERIDSGRKSLALRFTLQDTVRTLTDEVADQLTSRVLEALKEQFGATLRDY